MTIINYTIEKIEHAKICTLEEIKNYLRITYDYDDKLLVNLLEAAVEYAENFTSLSLQQRLITCKLSNATRKLVLKYAPILEVKKVEYSEQDITKIFGAFDSNSINFADDYVGKSLSIQYVAGYGKQIPHSIKLGVMMHIASMYEASDQNVLISSTVKDLYMNYRTIRI